MADEQHLADRDPYGSFGRRPITTVDDRIWQGAFKRRINSMWMGMLVGLLVGAALGVGFAFLPYWIGITAVAPTAVVVLACAGTAGAVGIWQGSEGGAAVGASAGAVTSGTKEVLAKQQENMREMLGEMRAMEARLTGKPVPTVPQEAFALNKDLPQADGESRSLGDIVGKYINLKVGLLFVAVSAGIGAVAAFAPATPLIAPLLNAALELAGAPALGQIATAQLVGLCSGAGALLGTTFGINFPVIANKISNAFGTALSGNWFQKPSGVILSSQAVAAPSREPAVTKREIAEITAEELAQLAQRTTARASLPKADMLSAMAASAGPARG